MVDGDHCKRFNDSYGHLTGDQVLVGVARRLEASLRAEDTVARVGGDEFVMLAAGIESPHALAVLMRMLQAVVADPVEMESGIARVTASIGASVYPRDGADLATLQRAADTAMYRAKHGRLVCEAV